MSDIAEQTPLPKPLSIEEAKERIRAKFNLIIDEDDPVMLCVLLEQAFHTERENQFKGQMNDLIKLVEGSSIKCVDAVNESLSLLKDEALKGSLENTLAAVSQTAKENDQVAQKIRAHGRVLWVATGLIWLAVIAQFIILK